MYPASKDGWAENSVLRLLVVLLALGQDATADKARCDHGGWTGQPILQPPLSLWEAAPPGKQVELSVLPHRAPPHLSHPSIISISIFASCSCRGFTTSLAHSDSLHPPGPSAGGRAECAASTWREQGLIPPKPSTINSRANAGVNIPTARGVPAGEDLWWRGPWFA